MSDHNLEGGLPRNQREVKYEMEPVKKQEYPRGSLHQCGEEPETHFQYHQCQECNFSTTMFNSIVNTLELSIL